MNWVHPPERIRRFSVHQIAQHAIACLLGLVLAVSGAGLAVGAGNFGPLHVDAGLIGALFFLYHLVVLVATGIRYDLPWRRVACVPSGADWRALRDPGAEPVSAGKYTPAEKGDYLNLLLWSIPLVATGLLLRWPGRLGVPGPGAYAWIRAAHAGCGAAILLHILVRHVPDRWFRMPDSFRMAIVRGTVPLAAAEERSGWIEDLVAEGILVPLPEEPEPEPDPDSRAVRELFETGNRLAREGRFAEAASSFEGALRLYPQYSQARFNLAVARMRQGRPDLAKEQLLRFLEDDPFNPMVEKARELLRGLSPSGEEGGR
ncbi:MAG: hypothetical protein Kow00128_11420 [Deltaproteobacteria bacterium]